MKILSFAINYIALSCDQLQSVCAVVCRAVEKYIASIQRAAWDLQLKKHGIQQVIIMGLIAHTCVEATVRYAAELGYQVTMVKDATADYAEELMHAALDELQHGHSDHGRNGRHDLFSLNLNKS